MKRPTTLLSRILLDEGLQTNLATTRDIRSIECRFEDEGMSFLTITLPSLDDALIQGLTKGFLTPADFPGFKPWRRGGKLPALLSGFFRNIFNDDGWLKEKPCIASIRAIRQVTRLFKKVELPCSAARIQRAYERYLSNDQGIHGPPDSDSDFGRVFDLVCGYLWADLEVLSGELYCSPGVFGTGATAERVRLNHRHSIRRWPRRGDESFPAAFHACSSEDDLDTLRGIEFLSEEQEEPVRVVQVPKTLKTPRTISVEPSYMMLRQQSVAKPLMVWLEEGYLGFKSIRFSDQSVNKELARVGSLDGSLATIDLSDASDLVGNDLVKRMLKTCPSFLAYLQDSRSTRAIMPDTSVITLRKFASMGSALCFPVEAMVFYSIVLSSMVHQSGRVPSRTLLERLSAKIAVYGDDIIVPTDVADSVMDWLGAFGLRVNHSKSFTRGLFRESCGGDYYNGEDVTPSYLRALDDTVDTRNPRYVAACVSLSNQFYMKGLWHASQYLRDLVESSNVGPLQCSTHDVGCLTWASVFNNTGLRYDTTSGGYTVRGPKIRIRRQDDNVLDVRGGMLLAFGPRAMSERLRSMRDGARTRGQTASSFELTSSLLLQSFGQVRDHIGPVLPPNIHRGRSIHHGEFRRDSTNWLQSRSDCSTSNPIVPVEGSVRLDLLGCRTSFGSGDHGPLGRVSSVPLDFLTSVRPRSLKMKVGKVPAFHAGLNW